MWLVAFLLFVAMTMGQAVNVGLASAERPGWLERLVTFWNRRHNSSAPPLDQIVIPEAAEAWAIRLTHEAEQRDRILFAQNPLAFWNDPHRYGGLRLEEWEEAQGECDPNDPYENELAFGGFPDVPGPSDPFAYSVDSDGAHRIERRDPLPVNYGRVRMKPVPVMWQGVARVPGTVEVKQIADISRLTDDEMLAIVRMNKEAIKKAL